MPEPTDSKPESETIAHDAETSLAKAERAREHVDEAIAEASAIDEATAERIERAGSTVRESEAVVESALSGPEPAAAGVPAAPLDTNNVPDFSDLADLVDQLAEQQTPAASAPEVVGPAGSAPADPVRAEPERTETPSVEAALPGTGLTSVPAAEVPDTSAPSPEPVAAGPAVPERVSGKLGDVLDAVAKTEASVEATTSGAVAVAPAAPEVPAAAPIPVVAPAKDEKTGVVPSAPAVADQPAADGSVENIESLDADLAALTESLLAADATGAAPDPEPSADVPPAKPSVAVKPAESAKPAEAVAASETEPAGPAPAPASVVGIAAAAGTPAAASAVETASVPTAAPATSSEAVAAAKKVSNAKAQAAKMAESVAAVGVSLAPGVVKVLGLASIPLRSRPKVVRDVIGVVGLWTLNLAVLAWFYAIFLYKPPVPVPATPPVELHGGEAAGASAHEPAADGKAGHGAEVKGEVRGEAGGEKPKPESSGRQGATHEAAANEHSPHGEK